MPRRQGSGVLRGGRVADASVSLSQSEAIRSNQKQSEAIRSNPKQSEAIRSNPKQSPRRALLTARVEDGEGGAEVRAQRGRVPQAHLRGRGRAWKVGGRAWKVVEGLWKRVEGRGRSVEAHGRAWKVSGRSVEGRCKGMEGRWEVLESHGRFGVSLRRTKPMALMSFSLRSAMVHLVVESHGRSTEGHTRSMERHGMPCTVNRRSTEGEWKAMQGQWKAGGSSRTRPWHPYGRSRHRHRSVARASARPSAV